MAINMPKRPIDKMSLSERKTEIRMQLNHKQVLKADYANVSANIAFQNTQIIDTREDIREIKEKATQCEDYLEEVENKNRITYLDRIVNDATREKRHYMEDLQIRRGEDKRRLTEIREDIKDINILIDLLS